MATASCCARSVQLVPSQEGAPGSHLVATWVRLGIALVLAGQAMIFGLGVNLTPPDYGSTTYWLLHGGLLLSSLVVIVLLGPPLLKATWEAVCARTLTVEMLFVLSMSGALVGSLISTLKGEGSVYYEVVAVVLAIYTFGKTLGQHSRNKALAEMATIKESFDYAFIEVPCGERQRVHVSELNDASRVIVQPGEGIPVDGEVVAGESFVKEIALTGEPVPVVRGVGEHVLAGTYVVDGQLVIRPTKAYGERTLDGVMETIETAQVTPSRYQAQADRIMQWFLPLVVAISTGTFVYWFWVDAWSVALFNSMAVLLVACPCAIGLATPLAVWGGLWKCSTFGLVAKSGQLMDRLAEIDTVVFDKTGTLSEEGLVLLDFIGVRGVDLNLIKNLVARVEQQVSHPVARALQHLDDSADAFDWEMVSSRTIPAQGVEAELKSPEGGLVKLRIGEFSWMPEKAKPVLETLRCSIQNSFKKIVYISFNDKAGGIAVLEERLREELGDVFNQLHSLGVAMSILTGDQTPQWASIEGIEVCEGLTPIEKVDAVKRLEGAGKRVVFVGDGVNDSPAMAVAPASIAMDSGAALAQSSAMGIVMGASLSVVPRAIELARALKKSLRGNMLFAVCYNIAGMGLAAVGVLHPVVAALLMFISSAYVSWRILRHVG